MNVILLCRSPLGFVMSGIHHQIEDYSLQAFHTLQEAVLCQLAYHTCCKGFTLMV